MTEKRKRRASGGKTALIARLITRDDGTVDTRVSSDPSLLAGHVARNIDPELRPILSAYADNIAIARELLLSTLSSAGYTALAEWLLLNPSSLENWAGDEARVAHWRSSAAEPEVTNE